MTETLGRLSKVDSQYSRPLTDEDRARLVTFKEAVTEDPDILTYLEKTDPDFYEQVLDMLAGLSIQARSDEWRTPGVGGRPEQLIPGTPGSFSDRTDWATWILMGGRGAGKSRTGAEAVREFLFGRKWHVQTPYFALIGKRLDDVRVTMVEATLMEVLPPGCIQKWNRGSCELWLKTETNTVYLRGFSSEAPENLRGPNLIGAWGDEFASWNDADRSPAAEHTTLSNLRMALRVDDKGTWTPRLILTTTPKPVRGLRNIDPEDDDNPGPGIVDDPATVVSNMSTLDNSAFLSEHFLKAVVDPLRGTRLYEQEVEGKLMDLAVGAQWSPELIESMLVAPTVPQFQSGGIVRTVIGVDPSIGGGTGDECGIVVAALCQDGCAYVLEDLSVRAPAERWAMVVRGAAAKYRADAIVVESNQGGELVKSVLNSDHINLPIVQVHAKRGKALRSEPVALLSDRGKVKLAGDFKRLTHQMKTFVPAKGQDSPDRLDAFVYAILWLLPPGNMGDLVRVVRGRGRR